MRKNRKGGNILIDLTSLLDVVFIVLLVLVCKLYSDESAIAGRQEDIAARQSALASQQQLYEDQIEALGDKNRYIAFVSVNARFDEDLITRHIEVMNSDEASAIPDIPELKGMNVSDSYDALRGYLEGYASENPDKVIVLSLNEDDEEILYRDEKALKSMLTEVRSAHDNVRLRDEEGS